VRRSALSEISLFASRPAFRFAREVSLGRETLSSVQADEWVPDSAPILSLSKDGRNGIVVEFGAAMTRTLVCESYRFFRNWKNLRSDFSALKDSRL
jgi:hypothetical protein